MSNKPTYEELEKAGSERKQMEDVLKESEGIFKQIFDFANVGKSIISLDGTILGNQAFADMLGYTLDELRDRSWQELTPPEDIDAINRMLEPILSGKQTSAQFEKRYIHKNGSIIWTDVSVVLNRASNGKPLHYITTVFDITERKLMENDVKASETRYRELFENMSSGVAVYEVIDNGRDFIFKDFNRAGERIDGQSRHELIGRSIFEVRPNVEEYGFIDAFRKALTSDQPVYHPVTLYQDDQVAGWYETYAYTLPSGDLVAVFDDVTERKQAEKERENLQKQLLQSQKIESVGRLAGGVAHDFNNISSVILGFSELALELVEKNDPLNEYLIEILNAAERSKDITQQLLTFARKQTVSPKVLDLNLTIGNMIKMLRRLIGEDIDLVWRPGTKVWSVKIDPAQIDQIMFNLCLNARDAIASVGKVTVETKNIKLDERDCTGHAEVVPGEYVLLSMHDDGCGMTPETQSKIFEPFFTTKDIGQGTGLGLSTVYGIIKQNNGFIDVNSEIEKGTAIRIYLPKHAGRTVKVDNENNAKIQLGRGETVLLVEDDDSILKLGKRILENLGYTVLSRTSATEAISLITEHTGNVNLLITDVVMPEMNGRELSERLQSLFPNLKTLFISGYTADIISSRGMLEEKVSFLAKPFSKTDLAVKVREVLDEGNG